MAASRTYGQLCGLAISLDLVGERWTLLLIRELARGPKRFRDLLDGLEGIGTNLLSARLKSLEAAGVIERVTLPPPSGAPAYALGPRGLTLEPILEELALWGIDFIDEETAGYRARAAWAAMSMRARMDREESRPPNGTFAFKVEDESFWLSVSDEGSSIRDGSPPADPDVSVEVDRDGFFAIATGSSTPSQAGALVEGDDASLSSLLHTFRLPQR